MCMSIALPPDDILAGHAGGAVPANSATAINAVAVPEADRDGQALLARYRVGQTGA